MLLQALRCLIPFLFGGFAAFRLGMTKKCPARSRAF
jgi:hypothetical protein